MRRDFAVRNETSDKFWSIEREATDVITSSGRIGTTGRSASRIFDSEEVAQRYLDKQVTAKLARGYVECEVPELPVWEGLDWSGRTMDEDLFWRSIELFDWSKTGDDDAVMRRSRRALASMPEEQIHRFNDILAELVSALDTRKHSERARFAGHEPSGDMFLYMRLCVVANGRARYEDILRAPSRMFKDVEFESLLYLGQDACEDATGRPCEYRGTVSMESYTNQAGWA